MTGSWSGPSHCRASLHRRLDALKDNGLAGEMVLRSVKQCGPCRGEGRGGDQLFPGAIPGAVPSRCMSWSWSAIPTVPRDRTLGDGWPVVEIDRERAAEQVGQRL